MVHMRDAHENVYTDVIRQAVLAVLKRRTSMSPLMLARLERRMQRANLTSVAELQQWVRGHNKLDKALKQFLQRFWHRPICHRLAHSFRWRTLLMVAWARYGCVDRAVANWP